MAVDEIIDEALRLGVYLYVEDNKLKYTAKENGLPQQLKAKLKENKNEIISFLTDEDKQPNSTSQLSTNIKLIKRNSSSPLLLSYAQQRLWFLNQYLGPNAVYNMSMASRLCGEVNVTALIRSVEEIVCRHEVLRTRFEADGDEVYQIIDPVSLDVEVESVYSQSELKSICQNEGKYRFDLSRDKLCRIRLLHDKTDEDMLCKSKSEQSSDNYVLLITMHHSVSDGWSLGIFFNELLAIYQAFKKNEPSPLEPLPIQYADYAMWQREWLQDEVLEKQLGYWRDQLEDIPQLLTLPTDRPRPLKQSFKGRIQQIALSQTVSDNIKELSRKQGVTLYMSLLSAFSILLSRYSGQDDIVIGSPIANRVRKETEGLIGFFVNTLVMRCDLRQDLNFLDVLKQTREVALQSYAHQDIPFEQLVEKLSPERSLSHSPLFQVMFTLQNLPMDSATLSNLALTPLSFYTGDDNEEPTVSRFDLTFTLHESTQGIVGNMEYNTDLFDRSTIVQMLNHFEGLLEAIVAAPQTLVSQLDFLSDAEKKQQLLAWNVTQNSFPQEHCIHELFEAQVERDPEAIALVFEQQRLSYGELNHRANQVAHYLIKQGVVPEALVGICVERGVDMVVGILGILKSGGAYVPIDPSYPEKRLNYLFEDSGVKVVLSQSGLESKLLGLDSVINCQLLYLDKDCDASGKDKIFSSQSTANIDKATIELTPDNLAYVIYTSGTTGNPKGVLIPHCNIPRLFSSTASDFNFDEKDTWTLFHSYAFDFSVWEIWGALSHGGRLVVVPSWVNRSPEDFYSLIINERVTVLNQTPTMFNQIIKVDCAQQQELSLRTVIFGGEALDIQQLKPWFERHDEQKIQLVNMYGITETTVHVTYRRLYQADLEETTSNIIGNKLADLELYLLDSGLSLVPVGVIAQIYVGGAGVARGYLHRKELTESRFIENPFKAGERLYRTGDLGRYLPNGELEYMGRIDHQVKIRGFRIELGEIESVLQQHEQVTEVVVLAREDEPGNKRLVAYVVGKTVGTGEGNDNTTSSVLTDLSEMLRDYAQAHLPSYMVPSAIVELAALPLTSNGKIDLEVLPLPDMSILNNEYSAPRGITEELLSTIWCDVLKLERIGMRDNFFTLGGHSLLVTQLVSRIREIFGVELSIRDLFEQQTMHAQAQLINQAQLSNNLEDFPVQIVSRDHPLLLSYAQQRLWFLSRYMGPSAVYNIPMAMRLRGKVNENALMRSLEEIVNRHEALRTRFEAFQDSAVQIIESSSFALEVESIISEVELRDICQSEANYRFDLSKDLLCRMRLLLDESDLSGENERSYVLLVTMHHSVSDGWSTGIFFKELVALYQAFKQDEVSPLAPLPIQYVDYAQWQRQWLPGEILDTQLSYWREQLQGLPPLLTLPTDRPRPKEQNFRGNILPIHINESLSKQLQALSQAQGVTLYMSLLSAFLLLMSRYSGQDDVAIGTPIANRTRKETEELIGFFVNTLVIRGDLSKDPSFVDLLKIIREIALEGYSHQDIPFEQLVEDLNPERSLSHSPLFQVMFALQNSPVESASLPDIEFEPLVFKGDEVKAISTGVSRFDLTLTLSETPQGITGGMEYNTDLFDESTIVRMLSHYERLLAAIVEAPETHISKLKFLSQAEKQQQLIEWNSARVDYPRSRCIHELFEAQVASEPTAIALVYEQKILSYFELNNRANQLAHYLIAQGVGPQTCVGLCVEDTVEMLVASLGILKTGGACVALDPKSPALRLAYQIEDSGISLIVTRSDVSAAIELHQLSKAEDEQGIACGLQFVNLDAEYIGTNEVSNPQCRLNALALACVFYTNSYTNSYSNSYSNSYTDSHSGEPKAHGMSHQNISCLLYSDCSEFSSSQSLLCGAPISFDAFVFDAWRALLKGEQYKVPTQAIEAYRERIQHVDCQMQPQALGRAVSNNGLFVLNPQGELVAQGVVGELYLSGDSVSLGYLNQASLTAEHFVPDPFNHAAGERLYRSGDRVRYLADGQLEYLGRVAQQAKPKTQAKKLAQDDLTTTLLKLDGIKALAIVEREGKLVCYLVPTEAHIFEAKIEQQKLFSSVSKHLRSQYSLYLLPEEFVVLAALPLTENGRLDSKALPLPAKHSDNANYIAPQTDTEKALVEIWQQKLGLDKIGLEDNYFVLGGDSIRSIALVAEAKKRRIAFSIKDLFAHPTVGALAAAIDKGGLDVAEFVEIAPFALLTEDEHQLLDEEYDEETLEDAFPLSMMQQGMVLLALKQSHLNVYENLQVYHFDDRWDPTLFEQALAHLMNKHPMLKSVYHLSAGRPLQLLLKDMQPNLAIVDLSEQDVVSNQESINQWMQTEKAAGIDTSKELWRATVHLLPEDRFVFGMFIHHAMWDGWSLESFITELYSTYAQLRNSGEVSGYKALPSYNQFIALEQKAIKSTEQRDYWQSKFEGANLPWWTGREKSPSIPIHCDISVAKSQNLTALAKTLGVQEKSVWCSVYLILLALLDGSDEVVGPVINQGRPEIPGGDKMVGVFLNALPLCVSITGKSWVDFIKATDRELREQHGYRHYPLVEIQKSTGLELSSSLFTYTNWHVYYEDDSQARSEEVEGEVKGEFLTPSKVAGWAETNYLLSMSVYKSQKTGQYGMSVDADTGIFDEEFRLRIPSYVTNIVHQIEHSSEELIDKTLLLGDKEAKQLLIDWNAINEVNTQQKCIHEVFEAQVERDPEAIALVFEQQRLSYRELNSRANQVAHYLIKQGVVPEVLVGLCVERSVDMVVGILGILKSGGAYVPIDPGHPQKRLNYLLEDSRVKVVLSQSGLESKLSALDSAINCQFIWLDKDCDTNGNNNILSSQSTANIDKANIELTPDNLAYVIYTSGTTGNPKGVLIPHSNIPRLFSSTASEFNFNEKDTWTLFHSYAFDFSVWEIWGALSHGGRLVIVPSWISRSPEDFYSLLINERVTVLNQTPTMFNQMIKVDCAQQQELSLRTVIFGGEALEIQQLKPWFERHSDEKIQLVNMYGITETTVHVTYRRLYQAALEGSARNIIGNKLADLELYLLDGGLSLVPVGVSAEIYVGGAGVARGYLNQKELTDSRFIQHPFKAGERLYRTGDLGRFSPNGELEYMGRIDHQVKIKGFRIELGEIESVLQQHEQAAEVVVLAREDEPGNKRLVAYVVGKGIEAGEGSDNTTSHVITDLSEMLRDYANSQLPGYMVPSAIVELASLPLTSNGKIDLNALPIPDFTNQQAVYVAPETENERTLCEIWQEVLGIERVGVQDNFFSIGGDSILSIRIVAKARSCDLALSVKDLFEFNTIVQLAKQMDKGCLDKEEIIQVESFSLLTEEEQQSLGKNYLEQYDDVYPMSELQLGMVFHSQLDEMGMDFNNILSCHVAMEWNEEYFKQAVAFMFAQHPVMRTGFDIERDRPLQMVYKTIALPLFFGDIRQLSKEEQDEFVVEWVEQQKVTKFDWQGPLFKIFIHRRTEDSFEFGTAHHHTVYDGWSDASFVSQLFIHYQNLLSGKALPPLKVDYLFREFILLEQQALANAEAKAYWVSMLDTAPKQQIPRNRQESGLTSRRTTKKVKVEGFAELSNKSIQLAKKLGVPLQSLLLAVHSKVLSMLSGQTKALTSVVVNGRPEKVGGDQGLGLFLNAVPVCFELGNDSWEALIRSVSTRMTDSMKYRHYPSSTLQREMQCNYAEVIFNYTHFHSLQELTDQTELQFLDFHGFEQTNYDFAANFSRVVGLDELTLSITYDVSVYDSELIGRIAEYYQNALKDMLFNIDKAHSLGCLLSENETQQLLYHLNDTAKAYPDKSCVHELFEAQVKNNPNAIALVFEDPVSGPKHLSYGELNRRSNQLAHYLISQGVRVEERVGICVDRSIEMVVGILGIIKSGGVYVPIDPSYPDERISYMLTDSKVDIVLSQTTLAERVSSLSPRLFLIDEDKNSAMLSNLSESNISNEMIKLTSANLSYIIYTSGSTGKPKGVMGLHRSIVNRVSWLTNSVGIDSDEVFCQKTSLGFVDHVAEIFQPLSTGRPMVILPTEFVKTPLLLTSALNSWKISQITLVPSLLKSMLEEEKIVVSTLKRIYSSGEVLNLKSMQEFTVCFPSTQLFNIYGSTEIGADISAYKFAQRSGSQIEERTSTIGQPISNIDTYVLSSECELVALGAIGELYVGGVGLSRGYQEQPGLTADNFVPHPFSLNPGQLLYRTGDLVRYLPDGNLDYIGRIDHQIKIRGYRIELGEIESVILSHNHVKNVVVVNREDEPGYERLVAYVVSDDNIDLMNSESDSELGESSLFKETLKIYIQEKLPAYMVPSVIVLLDALPLTPNGKMNKKALPVPDMSEQHAIFVAPVGEIEDLLSNLWTEVLKCDAVGRFDNFFELGGHSLLATRLVSRIRKEFSVEFKVSKVFEHPSLNVMATFIENENAINEIDEEQIDSMTEEEAEALLRALENK